MTFDVTIPVLNEEPTLKKQVLTLYSFFEKHFPDNNQWQIIRRLRTTCATLISLIEQKGKNAEKEGQKQSLCAFM